MCHPCQVINKLLLFAVLCYASCSGDNAAVPAGILSKDKMIEVLLDVHLAESSVNSRGLTNLQLNQLIATRYDGILKSHETTFPEFKKSFDYYLQHPEQFEEIYQEIVNRLTALEGQTKARMPALRKDGMDTLRPN